MFDYYRMYNLDIRVIRIFNTYGPFMHPYDGRVVTNFIRQALRGEDITIEQLREQGYKGFYVAIGAQKSARLGVAGEELTGVYGGVDFLRAVNLGKRPTIGKQVAVIGGGNVAIDVARAAVRRGADVTLLYRRGREEMPAADEEVAEAEAEGVKFRFLSAPVEILGEKGKATASYFFNRTDNHNTSLSDRQTFTSTDKLVLYNDENNSRTLNLNHRFNARVDYKFSDRHSMMMRTSFSLQDNNYHNELRSRTDNKFSDDDIRFVNRRRNFGHNNSDGYNVSN